MICTSEVSEGDRRPVRRGLQVVGCGDVAMQGCEDAGK
jgi:hypothetical protein